MNWAAEDKEAAANLAHFKSSPRSPPELLATKSVDSYLGPSLRVAGGDLEARPTAYSRVKLNSSRWTPEEDDHLVELVETLGAKSWHLVAERMSGEGHGPAMPHHTAVQCMCRWKNVLSPDVRKGPWTEEEDAIVRQLVAASGPDSIKWRDVAEHLSGRLGKQCRERWYNQLDPTINTGPWRPDEDRRLLEAQQSHGNRWNQIAKLLHGRTENAVKNRFNSASFKRWKNAVEGCLELESHIEAQVCPHLAACHAPSCQARNSGSSGSSGGIMKKCRIKKTHPGASTSSSEEGTTPPPPTPSSSSVSSPWGSLRVVTSRTITMKLGGSNDDPSDGPDQTQGDDSPALKSPCKRAKPCPRRVGSGALVEGADRFGKEWNTAAVSDPGSLMEGKDGESEPDTPSRGQQESVSTVHSACLDSSCLDSSRSSCERAEVFGGSLGGSDSCSDEDSNQGGGAGSPESGIPGAPSSSGFEVSRSSGGERREDGSQLSCLRCQLRLVRDERRKLEAREADLAAAIHGLENYKRNRKQCGDLFREICCGCHAGGGAWSDV